MKLDQITKKSKVNDVWRSGFCMVMVEKTRETFDDPNGTALRITFLTEHIKECSDCKNAMIMKNAEGDTARRLGVKAEKIFAMGGDISLLPGFEKVRSAVLDEYIHSGRIDKEFLEWMKGATARMDLPDQ